MILISLLKAREIHEGPQPPGEQPSHLRGLGPGKRSPYIHPTATQSMTPNKMHDHCHLGVHTDLGVKVGVRSILPFISA